MNTPQAKPTKNAELQGQSLLVRTVASTLDIAVPSDHDKQFRATLLRRVAGEIAAMPPGLLIRLYESACAADYPDADVVAFRLNCQRVLAKHLTLAEYKAKPQPQPQTAKPA